MGKRVSKVEETEVEVVPYDFRWSAFFAIEANAVQRALGDVAAALEHFGSTSVPGLAAKPIIDILVGWGRPAPPASTQLEGLRALGYEYLGEDGRRPGRYFFRKREEMNFNLSLVPLDGELWRDNLVVRDYLRAHPHEVQRYASLKVRALKASPHSLLGYQHYKRSYMEELKGRAQRYFTGS